MFNRKYILKVSIFQPAMLVYQSVTTESIQTAGVFFLKSLPHNLIEQSWRPFPEVNLPPKAKSTAGIGISRSSLCAKYVIFFFTFHPHKPIHIGEGKTSHIWKYPLGYYPRPK